VALYRLKEGESSTEEEIKDFCQGKIAHYKIPKYVVFLEKYPQTVTGKVQKFKLRELLIKELGLEEESKIETA